AGREGATREAAGEPGRPRACAGAAAATAASEPDQLRQGRERTRRHHRRERGEGAPHPADPGLVLAAAGAVANVAADARRLARGPLVAGQRQLLANAGAGGVARLRGLHQLHARPDQQRLDGRHGDLERLGELAI
ncbi:MAG: hypothetical protein AVDCRST_MAG65-1729, partial [uncultured Solirubrobacteraceae bacterium]